MVKKEERTSFLRYGIALVSVAVATVTRLLLSSVLGDGVPFIFYFPAVVASAWYGGLWPGLFSTGVSALIGWFLFVPSSYSLTVGGWSDPVRLLVFLLGCVFTSILAESTRRAFKKATESEQGEREERERLRVTLASIGDAVIATDVQKRVTLLNGVAEALTGWRQAEALGKEVNEVFCIVNEHTRKEVESPLVKVLREGAIVGLANHTILIARDGTERPIADSGAPIKDDSGKIIGAVLVFRDITASREAEVATSRLAAIVESSDDAIIGKTLEGVITSWNRAAERIFGYTAMEAIGQPIHIIIPPERRGEEARILRQLRQGDPIKHYETLRQRKDGTLIDVSLTISPIKDSEGNIIGASKTARDITERKRLEQWLRASEERLRLSHKVTEVGAWEWNIATNEVFWSPEYRAIYGHGAEDDPSFEKGMAVVVEEDREAIIQAISHALESGEEYKSEHRIQHPQKGPRWIQAIGRTVKEEQQVAARMIGLAMDVTARKQAEQDLREGAERLRLALEAAELGDWNWEAATNVVTLSARAAKILGVQGTEMPWAEMRRLLYEEDHEQASRSVAQAFSANSHFDIEYRVLRPGAGPIWVAAKGQAIYNEAGLLKGIRGVLQEITERKLAEEARRLNEEQLREADKRKDEFLAMLAHELRNPLAPIRNAVGLLKHYGTTDPKLQWPREVIDRQVAHMTQLVDDLLDVSRITHGKIELRQEIVEMKSIVERALETSRPLVDAKGQQLTVKLSADPLRVKGDTMRLAQVLSNLVSNAAKYTDAGGSIQLSVERKGDEIITRVSDNGVGVPADILPHIFELFAQAKRSLDRSQGGLGIGLTVVKALAEMHGGRVEARSDGPNKGSEFTVSLPAFTETAPEGRSVAAKSDAQDSARCCRILVVDDNVDSAESMALLLQFEGHGVKTAFDGVGALQAAREFRPNVVVLDIGLPGMNGYEVARELRQDGEHQRVVLIALTGYGQAEDRRRSQEAGFDHHLTKPVDYDLLGSLIKSLTFG